MKRLYFAICLLFSLHDAYAQDGYIKGEPTLAYWQLGNKAETIIVLHGGPSVQHKYLRPEFDALCETGQVIYYDQRGCGKSEAAERYTWQEHVKDLKKVVDTFSKGNKVVLAGSSWGSLLAILYAYSYPDDVKGLILTGTVAWPGEEMNNEDYLLYRAKSYNPPKLQTIKWPIKEERVVVYDSAGYGVKEKTIVIEKEIEEYVGDYRGETRLSLVMAPSFSKLKDIRTPVLVFNGNRKDCKKDWGHKYVEVFPFARLKTIHGACHDPWMSDPTTFFNECNLFVSKLSQQPGEE